jgi:hypothetical protein
MSPLDCYQQPAEIAATDGRCGLTCAPKRGDTVHRDRRIGERVEIGPINVTWLPATAAVEGGRWVRPRQGSLVEISATGARVLTQARDGIEVGSWIELDVEGDCAVVAVQRIAETTEPAGIVYIVEFVMLAPTLRTRVDHALAAHLENRGLDRGAAPVMLAPRHPHEFLPAGHEQQGAA